MPLKDARASHLERDASIPPRTARSGAGCPTAAARSRASANAVERSPADRSTASLALSCPAQCGSNQLDGGIRHPRLIQAAAVEPTWMRRPCSFQFAPARKDHLIARGTCLTVETIDDELPRSPAHCLEGVAIACEGRNRPCERDRIADRRVQTSPSTVEKLRHARQIAHHWDKTSSHGFDHRDGQSFGAARQHEYVVLCAQRYDGAGCCCIGPADVRCVVPRGSQCICGGTRSDNGAGDSYAFFGEEPIDFRQCEDPLRIVEAADEDQPQGT